MQETNNNGIKEKKVVKSVFETLNAINVNDHTEKKLGLTYLSWAYAWAEVKKLYPDSYYTIYETTNPQGYTCNYFTDGRTCWVKTGVTIKGLEHIEELPVMDARNNSIMFEKVTSFDVNKAIQRSLTKACARHGLGLYIYAGEDLPEGEESEDTPREKKVDNNQKRTLTVKQLELLNKLDKEIKEKLVEKLGKPLEELTINDASKLIDAYKAKGLI